MEHNAIQWLGAPSCQRGSFSFYKSVGSRTRPDGPVRTWRLGEFYFIRCGPQEPVCLAEVTLLWEDQTQRHPLASARLYFLPEDTPKGRTRDHGEDEVLAVSRKMVVKVEDLVRWSCSEEDGWKVPGVPGLNGINGVHKELRIQGPIQELRIQGPIQEPQTEDLHTEDLQNKDSTQDPTQDLQTKDSTQNPQTQDPIQDPQTKGPIQDPQTKGPIQGPQTKGPIQDPENKDPIQDPSQDPQTEDPIQDPSQNPENKDPIQDPSQDPQTEDPIQDPSQDPQTEDPVQDPSPDPQTKDPIQDPSPDPQTKDPIQDPSQDPQTKDPILEPAQDSAQEQQTQDQTQNPTQDPTSQGQTQNQTQERTENQSLDQEVKEEKVELKIAEEEGLKVKEEVEEGLKVKEEVELKVEETALKVEEKAGLKPEEAGLKQEGSSLKKEKLDASAPQWVKVLSYPQYCRFRSLQRRTQGGAAGLQLQDPFLLALGGLKVALSNTRVMYCRDTFNHPTLENNASFSWQFTGCPSLSLRGRPRKRKARDGKDSPTSSQSESWIDRMQENVMGSVESGCEGAWLPHPDEQFFLDQLFAFMDKQGAPIYKVPNLGFKKIDLFRMYSVVKRLGGYEKVTNDRLWKIVYNELGGCPGSTSAATCTRRHYERLMLPYEEHLRAGGIEIRIPEFPLPVRAKGMRGRKPGRKPGPKPKDKKPSAPSGPRTVVNPDGTVVVKRGRGRPPGKKNKSTLLAQAKLLAQQQAKGRVVTAGTGLGIRAGPGIRTGPGGAGRGRPPAHPSLHRVPPLHAPQPIAPAIISVNMPLTPDLSPRSAPFLTFQAKPQDLNRPESSSTNNTSSTTTTTTTAVPPQGLLLSALPHHFVSGFSPIKGLCHLDVFRNRIQRSENAASNAQDASQHLQPQQHQIVYSIQPKIAENSQGLSQNQDANRNRLPLPPLRVLPLDLDCSVQVRQLMRTRLGSTQFQTFTRRLSEALSHDVASKPVPCSPITPPPEQNLPLNLSKRLPQKRAHADGAEASAQDGEAKRQRQQQQEDFGSRLGQVGGQELRAQEEPADLSSPSRIRAFLLGLPPFQVKLEEDLNGARFPKLSQESRRLEVENLGMKRQDDDVIIVEDDRDEDDEDDEEQEAVVFVKEEFNGKEVKADKIAEENIEVLKQPPTLVLAQQS